jgi:hypothetical protein
MAILFLLKIKKNENTTRNMQYARAATAEWHSPLFIKKHTHKHDAS